MDIKYYDCLSFYSSMALFNSLTRSPLTASGLSKYTKRCYQGAQCTIAPDVPWWPALLTMYIRPCPLPACRSRSTLSIPPWGSIQSCSPSGTVNIVTWRQWLYSQTKVTGILSADIRSTRGMRACAPGARTWAKWSYQNGSYAMLIIELTYAIFPRSFC